jgi:hypothetical protein
VWRKMTNLHSKTQTKPQTSQTNEQAPQTSVSAQWNTNKATSEEDKKGTTAAQTFLAQLPPLIQPLSLFLIFQSSVPTNPDS